MIGDLAMNNCFHFEVEKIPTQRIHQTLEQKHHGYPKRLLIPWRLLTVAHFKFRAFL